MTGGARVHCIGPVLASGQTSRSSELRHTLQACFDDVERVNNQSRNDSRTETGKRLYKRR
jgi:hypothetical protein